MCDFRLVFNFVEQILHFKHLCVWKQNGKEDEKQVDKCIKKQLL